MKPFSPALLQFLKKQAQADVSQLALKKFEFPGFSKQEILQQITGSQKAIKKFPFLQQHPQYKFPVRLSIEQASSEATAQFKASIIAGKNFADLTGGMGMDTFFLGRHFEQVNYVEPNEDLCQLAKCNFQVLGMNDVLIHQYKASQFLENVEHQLDWIYIDPSRRAGNSRVIALENYQPDVISLWPLIRKKARRILIKYSPMQDLMEIKQKLAGLKKIWVLSIKHELKEVIAEFGENEENEVSMEIINIEADGVKKLWEGKLGASAEQLQYGQPGQFIYEPAPGILKSGVQDHLAQKYDLKKLHANSNLYTSSARMHDFPGRIFKYKATEKLQKKSLLKWVKDSQAHVIVRNFPQGAEVIKKKLGLKESGNIYLLATTLIDGKKVILVTERL